MVVRQPPARWRVHLGLAAAGLGIVSAGLGLLMLQAGNFLGLVPGLPGMLLIWGGIAFVQATERSAPVLCEARLTGDLLRIDGHDLRLDEDFFVTLGFGHGLLVALFWLDGETRAVGWRSYVEPRHPLEGRARVAERVRRAWRFEGDLGLAKVRDTGFGSSLLQALERNAAHDRLEVLRRHVGAAHLTTDPDPACDDLVDIEDGAPGRSAPYRGGATTPADGQRFLDDFRQDAIELADGVHLGHHYATVRDGSSTTVIPIGPIRAEAEGPVLEVRGPKGVRALTFPDPASAEIVARHLTRLERS